MGSRVRAKGSTSRRVVISYKRNVDPDQEVASFLQTALMSRGCEVFIDRSLRVGQAWAKEIEDAIGKCAFLIVLLSRASATSETVLGEIEMARARAQRTNGCPAILPVRLNYAEDLPYPLNSTLSNQAA